MGLSISAWNGFEGRVELSGARAVAAMFLRWDLARRRELSSSGETTWTLRAVLSYQKDALLLHPKFRRKVLIKVEPGGIWYELRPLEGVEPTIDGTSYVIEGATLCRTTQVGRP